MKKLIKKIINIVKNIALKIYLVKDTYVVKATYEDRVMTIEYSNGKTEQYHGDCTVWHKMPMMKRCTTSRESWLLEIWTYIEHYGNSYPNAHKKINLK
jgi:hypothetical protein